MSWGQYFIYSSTAFCETAVVYEALESEDLDLSLNFAVTYLTTSFSLEIQQLIPRPDVDIRIKLDGVMYSSQHTGGPNTCRVNFK